MIALLKAEVLKLRTTKLNWGLTISAGLTVVVLTSLLALVSALPRLRQEATGLPAVATPAWDRLLLAVSVEAQYLALVIGVVCVTSEFRHGTITPTFLAEARRSRVVAAKLLVSALGGLVVGVVAVICSAASGFTGGALQHADLRTMASQAQAMYPSVIGACVLFAIMGAGFGSWLRNQVVAIFTVLGLTVALDTALTLALPSVGRFLPSEAGQAMVPAAAKLGNGSLGNLASKIHLLPWWGGALVLLMWGVAAACLGSWSLSRSDIA